MKHRLYPLTSVMCSVSGSLKLPLEFCYFLVIQLYVVYIISVNDSSVVRIHIGGDIRQVTRAVSNVYMLVYGAGKVALETCAASVDTHSSHAPVHKQVLVLYVCVWMLNNWPGWKKSSLDHVAN